MTHPLLHSAVLALSLLAACADPADLPGAADPETPVISDNEPGPRVEPAADVQADRPVSPGPEPRTPDDWVHDAAQDAQAMLVGTVVGIEYGESAPDSQGFTTPHTWVTWQVERAYKGVPAGGTFTGRFIGGPNKARTGMLQVSGMPQFDLGDRDVLFVTHNGEWACPLVGGAHGRLRVIDEVVYTDDGRPLTLDDEGRIGIGYPVELEEVRSTTIAGRTFRTQGDASPPVEGPVPTPAPAARVLDLIGRIAADFPVDGAVRSADPREVFVVELHTPPARNEPHAD